ncbi:hypothetical protein [Bacteroides caccae]|jgi:hypothetical protein|uniref:hypothetical protein n=1 Tax=Bacteroides caccae TaxID=47678 RepID=UPI001F388708|nr:hypothetical protein [Bacteroides caccae]MCE8774406.1 hypothetical protein [Bacteroides caccae]DAU54870.1 MAG TPA: hypothetical protein [Caudoviricetes sp.]
MSRSKEYKAVKNYIHNELGLSRDYIREIMIPLIKEEVNRVFRNTYGDDVSLENWIRNMVNDEIKQRDFNIVKLLCKEVIKDELAGRIEIMIKEKRD